MCVDIYPKNILGIGNDADNYVDGSNNQSTILKLIQPLTFFLFIKKYTLRMGVRVPSGLCG
jgi:hypothetical protein